MATTDPTTDAITYTNCNCTRSEASTARAARANRVFHHNSKGGVVVLVEAKRARIWQALVVSDSGWRSATFNSAQLWAYHEAQFGRGVKRALPSPGDTLIGSISLTGVDAVENQVRWSGEKTTDWAKAFSEAPFSKEDDLAIPFATDIPASYEAYTPRAKKVDVGDGVFSPPVPNPESHWYESVRDAKLLKDFAALRLAGHTTNLMVVGPSGFGKTQGIIRFGKSEGVPVHVVNCQAITTPEKWIGQMQVDPDRGTYFEVANHVKWVERTHPDCTDAEYCIILYDEITRLRPELANMQFSLLDDQQGLEVPQIGRRITMDPRNVVIATANIGTPYTGAFTMDWALRGRFDVNLERTFPPAEEEVKILTSATGISEKDAESLVRVAAHTRVLWQNGELESPVSTRSLVAWARFIGGGYTIKDAAEYTIAPLYSEDGGMESDRAKVKLAVDGKVGL